MVYSRGKSTVPERRGGGTRILFLVLGVLALAAAASAVLVLLGYSPFGLRLGDSELLSLWNAGDYDAVFSAADSILESDPLDPEGTTFGGFAAFYTGINAVRTDEQEESLQTATRLLRRALVIPNSPFPAERDYVLGKTYFHRGADYMDLSIRYLERALAAGHESADARTYLGLANAELGRHEASVDWFEQSLAHAGPQDIDAVRLRAAEAYVAVGNFDAATSALTAALLSLDDDFLLLVARNQLAEVYLASGDNDSARSVLEATIDQYPESADAYYYLGVIYDDAGDIVLARDYWRRAREIDPNHQDSLRRLANREG